MDGKFKSDEDGFNFGGELHLNSNDKSIFL